jgi:hypothetical protein
MSAFSSIRFFRAFLLTTVRRMAQVTMVEPMIRIVAASSIQPPQFK